MKRIVKMVLPVMLAVTCIGGVCAQGACAKEVKEEPKETVKINCPEWMTGSISTQERADEIANAYGIDSVKLNKDGTLTFKMTDDEYEAFLKQIREEDEAGLANFIKENAPSVDSWGLSENMSNYEIYTNNADLTTEEYAVMSKMANVGARYNVLAGKEKYEIKVTVKDAKSKKTIQEITFDENSISEK